MLQFKQHGYPIGRRGVLAALCLAVPTVLSARTARADELLSVDLQLVLAVDVSGSVNQARFELQKRGYVAAFRNPKVLQAIRTGATKSIGVTVIQWTGPTQQSQVLPWTLIKDEVTIEAFAAGLDASPRALLSGGTSVSGAIDYAVGLFPNSPYVSNRRVIDVSGDGANNRGRAANLARDEAINAGIVINGLPILELEPNLEDYYRDNVIGGPNAFVIAVARFEEFGDAILRKLILEIADIRQIRVKLGRSSTATSGE